MVKMLGKRFVCPLLNLPGFTKARFRRDWLHGSDLGVAADGLGQAFERLEKEMPGANRKERVAELWKHINTYYDNNDIKDRLLGFKFSSFKAKGKAQPKLRGGAAAIRALVPFAEEACTRLLDAEDIVDATIIQCMTWLHECYKCLKHDAINWQPRLERAARMFSNNYVALHEATGNRWRPKPKLHYFLELCSDGTKPSLVWTYRDEDFGGGWAAMARRRGGKRGPTAQSSMAIHNWRNSQPIPRLM